MQTKTRWIDQTTGRLSLAAIIIVLLLGWLVYHFVLVSPERVFWGMIDNNLRTTGVTSEIVQSGAASSLRQTTRLQFGAQNLSHSLVTLTQKDKVNDTVVKTETIGTPTADFSRYLSIETNQKNALNKAPDFSKVIGVWGKVDSQTDKNQPSQYLSQAAFTIVPFANLNGQKRREMVSLLKQKHAYDVNFDSVKGGEKNGHRVLVFKVGLQPRAYLEFLRELIRASGLSPLTGINPAAYGNNQTLNLVFKVDKFSRQLISVNYDSSGQEIDFKDYGLVDNVKLPAKTIPFVNLRKRLQNVK